MQKNTNTPMKPMMVAALAILCCFLWGSAFPGIKIGYRLFQIPSTDTGTVILFAGLRFFLAGILTILFASIMNRNVILPSKSAVKEICVLSIFQTILQYLLFYIGLANTTGVKASIIQGCNVFVALIIASVIFHLEKMDARKLLGCFIGFIGVVIVNLNGTSMDYRFHLNGEGFIFLSVVAYSISSVLMKYYSKKEDPVMLSGYQFILGGAIMILAGILLGGHLDHVSLGGITILIYLSTVSAVAYTIWGILLKRNPVSKVTVYGFMTPVCGVLLSALLLREDNQALGITSLIALIFVCFGIYFVNTAKETC